MTFFLACAAGAARTRPRLRAATATKPSLRPNMLSLLAVRWATSSWRARSPRPSAYRFCRVEPGFGTRVAALDHERAVALQRLSVDLDLAALAQVADHVPVNRRLVDAAGLRV